MRASLVFAAHMNTLFLYCSLEDLCYHIPRKKIDILAPCSNTDKPHGGSTEQEK